VKENSPYVQITNDIVVVKDREDIVKSIESFQWLMILLMLFDFDYPLSVFNRVHVFIQTFNTNDYG